MVALYLYGFAVAATLYEQAVTLIEKGNPAAAIPLLEQASRQQPKDARVWKALGVAHASMNDYNAAEPAFANACRIAPKLPDACYYHGRALYALNRFPDSLTALAKAPAEECSVQLAKGQAHEGNGNAKHAEALYGQAMRECGQRLPEVSAALGLFLIREGRQHEAEPVLRHAVERFPNHAGARIHLGRLLVEKNLAAQALPHLEAAVRLASRSAQAHLLLAKAYTRLGRTSDAKPHFEAAAQLETDSQGR
ncbi:MAG: tetratricopeptide repeat protein [Bryobacterales bacterium]|nr:tetratricopeptide repeat protein [Bryobacterales bacterium]